MLRPISHQIQPIITCQNHFFACIIHFYLCHYFTVKTLFYCAWPKILYTSSMIRHECSSKLLTIATFPSPKTSKLANCLVSSVNLPLSSTRDSTGSLYYASLSMLKRHPNLHSKTILFISYNRCIPWGNISQGILSN